jgi:hypothetical protein
MILRAAASPPKNTAAPAAEAAVFLATSPHVMGVGVPVSIVIASPTKLEDGTVVLLLNFITNSCISPWDAYWTPLISSDILLFIYLYLKSGYFFDIFD